MEGKIDVRKEEVFKGKYLRGEDIEEFGEVPVIIDRVDLEEVAVGEDKKPVLYFTGKEKGMVCNSGNWDALAYAYGPESDDWAGKKATLFTIIGTFQGVTKPWLRIKGHKASQKPAPKGHNSENPAAGMKVELDDEVPFNKSWQ